jgi:ElaB/YqjD/DUF883 family membrane-anchored ribosome-binding protein
MNSRTERSRSSYEDARHSLNRGIGNTKAAADAAIESADELVERTRRAASSAVDTGADYARSATRKASSLASDFEDAIHRNPLMAVGIAAFLGWMYGHFRRR